MDARSHQLPSGPTRCAPVLWSAALLVPAGMLALGLWRSHLGVTRADRWGAPALAVTASWALAALASVAIARRLVRIGRQGRPLCRTPTAPRLSLSLVSLAVALAAAELVARRWLPSPALRSVTEAQGLVRPNDWQMLFCEADPELGWRGVPLRSGWFERPGFRVWVEQNAAGFRDIELPADPASSVQRPRVLLLGDSFVWGCGVEQHEAVTAQLRQRLPADVFNLGVCGYGTDQSLLALKRWSARVAPDWVIYCFFVNDPCDNRAAFKHGHGKPRFALAGGELRLESVPSDASQAAVEEPCASERGDPPDPFALAAHPVRSAVRAADYYVSPHSVLYRQIRRLGITWSERPGPVELDELTAALIVAMRQACDEVEAGFTVAFIPDRAAVRRGADRFAPLRDWCRDQGIDCLDLTGALGASSDAPYLAEGHWNAAGHRVAAAALAEHLRGKLSSPLASSAPVFDVR